MNTYQLLGIVIMICYPCLILATSWKKMLS